MTGSLRNSGSEDVLVELLLGALRLADQEVTEAKELVVHPCPTEDQVHEALELVEVLEGGIDHVLQPVLATDEVVVELAELFLGKVLFVPDLFERRAIAVVDRLQGRLVGGTPVVKATLLVGVDLCVDVEPAEYLGRLGLGTNRQMQPGSTRTA